MGTLLCFDDSHNLDLDFSRTSMLQDIVQQVSVQISSFVKKILGMMLSIPGVNTDD